MPILSFKTVIQNDKYISCSIIYIFVWGKKKSWGEKYQRYNNEIDIIYVIYMLYRRTTL
jgi:hypothetical protein